MNIETLIQNLYETLILESEEPSTISQLLDSMPPLDQRRVLTTILNILASKLPGFSDESIEDYPLIWAATGVIKMVIGSSQVRKDHLVAWLTHTTGAGLGETCGIRRAAVAVLGGEKETITMVLEKSLNQFSDQLYIKHSPMLQQEGETKHVIFWSLLLTHASAHSSPLIECRVCVPGITYQIDYTASDQQLPQCNIKPHRGFSR